MRVAGMNDKYLDLVARTAADQHAIAEITDPGSARCQRTAASPSQS